MADNFYARYPNNASGSSGVTSLNGQTGALTLVAGTNITITPGAGTLTINSTGGSSSSGVAGSVQFSDGAGGFSSDGATFFWDSLNNRLGIGTNTPTTDLDVNGDVWVRSQIQVQGASFSPASVSVALEIAGTDGALLLSRLTTGARDALIPVEGMIIYNEDVLDAQIYADGMWQNSIGANRSLSNLSSPTAINQDLIFDKGSGARVITKDDSIATQSLRLATGESSALGSGDLALATGQAVAGSGILSIATGISTAATSGGLTIQTGFAAGNSGTIDINSGGSSGGSSGAVALHSATIGGSGGTSGTASLATGNTGTGDGNSGQVTVSTGNAVDGSSGSMLLTTGDSTNADSGEIRLTTGTAGGTRGQIVFVDGSEGTAGYVWTSTDTAGSGAWMPGGSGGSPQVELRTITAPEAAAKSVVLSAPPVTPTSTILNIASAPAQFYGDDFTVSGSTLSWSGLALDGILAAGDRLTIFYI